MFDWMDQAINVVFDPPLVFLLLFRQSGHLHLNQGHLLNQGDLVFKYCPITILPLMKSKCYLVVVSQITDQYPRIVV